LFFSSRGRHTRSDRDWSSDVCSSDLALGWAEARARFDASRGVPFAGFAAMRIRGAILDGLRACDTLSRGDRKRAKAEQSPTAARSEERRVGIEGVTGVRRARRE